jgi:hypothetical protein
MRKLLQVVVCGLAVLSFCAVAADEKKSTETGVKADKKVSKAKEKNDKQGAAAGGTRAEPAPAPAPEPTTPKKDK